MKYDEHGNFAQMSDREAMKTSRHWLIGGLVVLLLLPALVWGASVMFSDIAGRGNQRKQINRAENRIFAQEQFHVLLADIRAYDQQIRVQQGALDAHPQQDSERDRLAQVVAGIKNQCISTVQQYNAEARKISKEKFLDVDLPEQVDTQDPSYDCK